MTPKEKQERFSHGRIGSILRGCAVMLDRGDPDLLKVRGKDFSEKLLYLDDIKELGKFIRALVERYNYLAEEAVVGQFGFPPEVTCECPAG